MGAGSHGLTDAAPLPVSYGWGLSAPCGAGLPYEQAGAFKRLNARHKKQWKLPQPCVNWQKGDIRYEETRKGNEDNRCGCACPF